MAVDRYTLTVNGMRLRVLTHGGILQSIETPDRRGKPANVRDVARRSHGSDDGVNGSGEPPLLPLTVFAELTTGRGSWHAPEYLLDQGVSRGDVASGMLLA
ncbi:hypothetical protein AB0C29_16045 [Actinoplanes sp. NPDC048791]|uniref:hypothetical protein n=1 Tax=Actinoplanes sp. NPDC048791 TaxID=3154623 RepID=UPI0033F1AF01